VTPVPPVPPPAPAPPLAGFDFAELATALAELGADAWLLFDFHGVNPVVGRVLGGEGGGTGMGTRRLFVLLPARGRPVAVAHRIEQHALAGFPGDIRPYSAWRELHAELRPLVAGKTLAMEVSPDDAVPSLDRVPHGVVELVQSLGARVVPSAPLVTRFAARWSATELAGHRRAAAALAEIAADALRWAGAETARGAEVREAALQRRVLGAIERAGLVTDHPPIVAFQQNSALPHYEPRDGADLRLQAGQVVLLDLWAGPGKGSVFADQTWMAFAGRAPDAEMRRVWDAVRGARDAVVDRLRERWRSGSGMRDAGGVTGAELDDVARGVIRAAGYAEYFVHRTGHSIDRDLHGSGPHLDNFETADTRALIAGVGFSVEPGIYLPGRFGMRSEINVFLDETGPEVSPPTPQQALLLI
jgi:Xaa-Pro aminopeptidase